MKKLYILLCLLLGLTFFSGCSENIDTDAIVKQAETIASQIDVEAIVTEVVQSIDWEELKDYAEKGYEALTEKFPALKAENVKKFIKDNGLELMGRLVASGDADQQENARKLGEIIKILNPELTDEVDRVIG